jgi:hypothetical protein
MEKLELRHVIGYVPYKLMATQIFDGIRLKHEVTLNNVINFCEGNTNAKIVLRPLSELSDISGKYLSECNLDLLDQMELTDLSQKRTNFDHIAYDLAVWLFENHFDVFGLIEKGLAVDINALNQ